MHLYSGLSITIHLSCLILFFPVLQHIAPVIMMSCGRQAKKIICRRSRLPNKFKGRIANSGNFSQADRINREEINIEQAQPQIQTDYGKIDQILISSIKINHDWR